MKCHKFYLITNTRVRIAQLRKIATLKLQQEQQQRQRLLHIPFVVHCLLATCSRACQQKQRWLSSCVTLCNPVLVLCHLPLTQQNNLLLHLSCTLMHFIKQQSCSTLQAPLPRCSSRWITCRYVYFAQSERNFAHFSSTAMHQGLRNFVQRWVTCSPTHRRTYTSLHFIVYGILCWCSGLRNLSTRL